MPRSPEIWSRIALPELSAIPDTTSATLPILLGCIVGKQAFVSSRAYSAPQLIQPGYLLEIWPTCLFTWNWLSSTYSRLSCA